MSTGRPNLLPAPGSLPGCMRHLGTRPYGAQKMPIGRRERRGRLRYQQQCAGPCTFAPVPGYAGEETRQEVGQEGIRARTQKHGAVSRIDGYSSRTLNGNTPNSSRGAPRPHLPTARTGSRRVRGRHDQCASRPSCPKNYGWRLPKPLRIYIIACQFKDKQWKTPFELGTDRKPQL